MLAIKGYTAPPPTPKTHDHYVNVNPSTGAAAMNSNCTVSALVFLAFASISCSSPARAEWVYCSEENQLCNPPVDEQLIRFGAKDKYYTKSYTNGALCSINVFGDPFPNATKHCDYWIKD
jgi:hypothetical protein